MATLLTIFTIEFLAVLTRLSIIKYRKGIYSLEPEKITEQIQEDPRLEIISSEDFKRQAQYIRIQLERIHHKSILRS